MAAQGIEGTPGSAFDDVVTVRRRMHASPDGAFGVLLVTRAGDELVVVGPVAHLDERERARVTGTWQEHHAFGMQVRASSAEPLPPSEEDGVLAYLRRVRHIGEARAATLLRRHGAATLEAVDRDPRGELRAAGLRQLRLEEAVKSWHGLRATRDLHLLLAPHGLAWLVGRAHKELGEEAATVLRERPYELTRLFGVGFATADRVARAVGVAADSPERARAGVLHVLGEAERDGSTCLPLPELAAKSADLLGAAPTASLLERMAREGDVTVEVEPAAPPSVWVARAQTAALEAELAARVRALSEAAPELEPVERPPRAAGVTPAPEQWAAVQRALAHRLSLVTGGPGTGKTATIRMICAAAAAQGGDIVLVAPTGRAARRIEEATGLDASTVHGALGWIPGEGPARDEADPLHADLIVLDETSMANLELLVTLLRAVGPRAHVVLVGDADQLAPVGAGKPFAELIAAQAAPATLLTHIFRQAAGSMIVRGAHAVRAGEAPSFAAAEGVRRDLFLIERAEPAAALEEIVSLVAERLPRHYGVDPLADVQVFVPVYRGPLGIDALNERLREALNPGGEPVLGRFRIGDKLMLSGRNLHELGLMNGAVLRLVDHDPDRERLVVDADGETVLLPVDEAPKLQLAYACSVHKGQGIELPIAVVVAHPAAGAFFLRREMLYTAMTRARTATVIVGRRDAVARAAATPDTARRHTRLAARLGTRA